MMRKFLCAVAALAALAAPAPAETRGEIALKLVEPPARCIVRRDTAHPVFHGCIDWHSSVHATWAMIAAMRLSGVKRYELLLDTFLSPSGIARERQVLAADPRFEMPYGRAWFLRLAIEYRATIGSERLAAMASDIADSMVAYYRAKPPDPHARDYASASWALINLYDYGVAMRRDDIVRFVGDLVRAHFLSHDSCDPNLDLTGGFMAVCSNWAWLVARVLPPVEFRAWLGRFLPLPERFVPLAQPTAAHQYGINFSRAWGLAGLYRATGDARWRTAAAAHFDRAYRQPSWWDGDYRRVGHWVAQFGMFALDQLAEP